MATTNEMKADVCTRAYLRFTDITFVLFIAAIMLLLYGSTLTSAENMLLLLVLHVFPVALGWMVFGCVMRDCYIMRGIIFGTVAVWLGMCIAAWRGVRSRKDTHK